MTPASPTRGETDAVVGGNLRAGGLRATDVAALVGSLCWLGVVLAWAGNAVSLGRVALFVSFAQLVLVPLGLGLVALPDESRLARAAGRVAMLGQLPAALLAVAGIAAPVGSPVSVLLVVPWLGVTGAIAVCGLARLAARGRLLPLPALAIDAALLYVPVGAVALLLHRAGVSFHFQPIIVFLTVVHYHYAGFVLPLVAGHTGAIVADDAGRFPRDALGRVGATATVVVIVNLALIAVGITFSPTVEVVAVALFTLAVAGFATVVLVRVAPAVPRVPGALLGLGSLVLFATMALALAYGYSAFPATGRLVTIEQLIVWHGTLNAFGFALPALIAVRLLDGRE